MDKPWGMLIINIGSTSTKLAWHQGGETVIIHTLHYSREDLSPYSSIRDQLPLRESDILAFLNRNGIAPEKIDLVVSRGGLGKPAPAGIYAVDDAMCRDLLEERYGSHPSALGPAIAWNFSKRYSSRAIVVDPPSTDEFHPLARISGLPEIERKSVFHSLNQKSAARRFAAKRNTKYAELNLVVAHLGGGISIGAHKNGRVVDATHGLSEGPLTPERAGSLPALDLVELAFSGTMDKKKLQKRLAGEGGLYAYLATTDIRRVEEMIEGGDEKARLVYEAMAYQIAKEIGAMCVVLKGTVDAIILTGGMAHSEMLVGTIREWVAFLAPVFVLPGEDEMTALAEGGMRVFIKEEKIRKYPLSAKGAADC